MGGYWFLHRRLKALRKFRKAIAADCKAATVGLSGHRQRKTAGKESGELRLGWNSYSVVARRVLGGGRVFWIDDNGRPHILEEYLVMEGDKDWACDRGTFLQFVRGIGADWPDSAIVTVLQRGADDLSSGTSFLTSLSTSHVGSLRNAREVVQVEVETQRGFLTNLRDFPRCRSGRFRRTCWEGE